MIHYCFHFFAFSFSCRKDREVRRKQRGRLLSEGKSEEGRPSQPAGRKGTHCKGKGKGAELRSAMRVSSSSRSRGSVNTEAELEGRWGCVWSLSLEAQASLQIMLKWSHNRDEFNLGTNWSICLKHSIFKWMSAFCIEKKCVYCKSHPRKRPNMEMCCSFPLGVEAFAMTSRKLWPACWCPPVQWGFSGYGWDLGCAVFCLLPQLDFSGTAETKGWMSCFYAYSFQAVKFKWRYS